ncbi:MAG: PKD domain-containing protein, partial [Pseudomonadota bacterium]
GDGSTSTGDMPSHTYNSSGTYQVILTVTTQNGLSSTTTLNPTVDNSPTSDSQPFIESLISAEDTKYIGSLVSFEAVLGNSADGDPFAVLFEIIDSNIQSAGKVWLKPIQISAGDTQQQSFSWLPVGLGTYHVNVGFYRISSNHQIAPVVERVNRFEVVARTPAKIIVGGGTISGPIALVMVILIIIAVRRRHQTAPK